MHVFLVAFYSFVSGACFTGTIEAVINGDALWAAILMFLTCLNAFFAYFETQSEK